MPKLELEQNPHAKRIARKFEKLINLMYTLRSERGCPWDRAQTLNDLKQYLLEETYELLHALDEENEAGMIEEQGDLLFQVVFQSQVMQEKNRFSLNEVLDRLVSKMIGRHPHVFADVQAGTPQEALASWESVKNREKGANEKNRRSVLAGVPNNLPALLQAHMISGKVARVGFDWNTEQDVWEKVHEELNEIKEAVSKEEKEEEIGDLLFTLVNIARKNDINAEDALRSANAKFRKRFELLESKVHSQGRDVKDLTLTELDEIWESVKKDLR